MKHPIYLTLLRFFLAPLFFLLYIYHDSIGLPLVLLPLALIGIACLSDFSDVFDGKLARKLGKVTDLGKLLDPMADAFFRLTVFFAFTQGEVSLPLFAVFLMFYRELLVSFLRTLAALDGSVLSARKSGKIKTAAQAVITYAILIFLQLYSLNYISLDLMQKLSLALTFVVALYTAASGIEYAITNRLVIKRAFSSLKKI